MNQAFLEYYRCPEEYADLRLAGSLPVNSHPGYFRFGDDLTCYGRSILPVGRTPSDLLPDALPETHFEDGSCFLPFSPSEVATNLRYERYLRGAKQNPLRAAIHWTYYALRPMLPVSLRRHLQKLWLGTRETAGFPNWPMDCTVEKTFESVMHCLLQASPAKKIPFIWFWPYGKSSCAVMTHDVETSAGFSFVHDLMSINDSYGMKSSFQLIPAARYTVTCEALEAIRSRGFEVNCHDLKHDGHLFDNYPAFQRAAAEINTHVKRFDSKGFRSGALYRNQDWMSALEVEYDMSVPNMARFDPQGGGCCTVMPYFIGDVLELPVTTIQDYTLFHVLNDYSMKIWNRQIWSIMKQHGLMNFIVHPDYILSEAAQNTYKALLGRLRYLRSEANLWVALPGEVNTWWRKRKAMKLVHRNEHWTIDGSGCEEARVAYAFLNGGKICYEFESTL